MEQIMKQKLIILLTAISFSPFLINAVSAQTKTASKPNTDTIQGKALISKSDCLSCHKPAVKLIGPSFQDIAKKYPSTPDNYQLLTQKIIKGGSGNWGPMAMSPHSTLPVADVKKMLAYILSIK